MYKAIAIHVEPRIIVYYVPRQSSRCLYEDTEFIVSEYKQLDCLGTYDTSSEIG